MHNSTPQRSANDLAIRLSARPGAPHDRTLTFGRSLENPSDIGARDLMTVPEHELGRLQVFANIDERSRPKVAHSHRRLLGHPIAQPTDDRACVFRAAKRDRGHRIISRGNMRIQFKHELSVVVIGKADLAPSDDLGGGIATGERGRAVGSGVDRVVR